MPELATADTNFQPSTPTEIRLWAALQAEQTARAEAEAEVAHLRLTARIPSRNPNPLMRIGFDGKLQFANPAASFLLAEVAGGTPSWTQPQLREAVMAAQHSGQTDYREVALDGKNFLLCTVPVPAEEHAMLYLTDVTDLRAIQEEIGEQKRFYSSILEHVPAVVQVLDADQRCLYISPYGLPDLERQRARLGKTFAEYSVELGLPARIPARRHRLFRRSVETRQSVSWEEQWPATEVRPTALYWQCYFQPIFSADGSLNYVLGYGLDVTPQRRAETVSYQSQEAERSQQAFTKQVLDLNPNLIYVRGADGKLAFANQAMREFVELLQRMAGSDKPTVPSEELQGYNLADANVLSTGQTQHSEERMTLPDGEVRWYQSVRCLLLRADGTRQVLVVSSDITALKAAQLAAEAAATARENFLANMSHEIRTPLNGVLGMANLLAKTELGEEQLRYVSVIQNSGRHLLGVVNDVLDMAKITSGKLEMEKRAFDLCDSMAQAAAPLAMQAEEKGIRVIGTMLRESCPLPWVIGDSYRLNQILINLLSNAVKFTPSGGTIALGGYFVSETEETLTTEFRVTDSGIGITPEKLDKIFEEFTQAYADTTRQFGGTGLGLSISRALVKQLGGTLTVQSTPGKGSSFAFTITLPKAPASARTAGHAPDPTAPILRGRRILLAEDNLVSSEVAQLLLALHGVEVDAAASGPEALELFNANSYDAVLMDIQMPGMNGLEATARLRQHPDPIRAATPVLALTANAFRADTEKYLAAGMNDTLAKPFEEAELLEKLAGLLKAQPVVPESAPKPAAATLVAEATEIPPASVETLPAEDPADEILPYDLTLLRETAHGSIVFMNRILTAFHSNTPVALNELSQAVAAADATVLAAVAHRLRPSLRLVGAGNLLPLVATMEAADTDSAVRVRAAQEFSEGLAALLTVLPSKLEE